MTLLEIKETLKTLLYYEDSNITHTIPGFVEFSYCKVSKAFQINTILTKNTSTYFDVDTAAEALYAIIYSINKQHVQ
ncbi:hypothetical protein [Priestia aryabhattai]